MRVSPDQARSWIIMSALVVGGVYAYRLLIEGKENVLSVPEFFTAWGATYFVTSLLPPSIGGPLALVIAAGDVLIQGKPLIADLQSQLPGGKKTAAKPTATTTHAQTAATTTASNPLPGHTG